MIPNATPSRAANKIRLSAGNRNVTVCAGIQKSGIVFLKTKFHCTFQFIACMICPIGIGVKNPLRLPPVAKMCVSVILWSVMKTGAKMVFIAVEMANATPNFCYLCGPVMRDAASSTPR